MNSIHYWIVSILITLSIGACAGRESSERAEARPAAHQSPEHVRRARAAQAVCREAYGHDALWFWTPEGHLVCRRGKGLL